MTGETELNKLIRGMKPELNEGEFVFCTLAESTLPAHVQPLAWFQEREGITLVLPKHQADALHLPYAFVSAWITLTIHSDLAAVGLTAAVSTALAEAGISCNIIAAYFHDHLFVPSTDGERAIGILQKLAQSGTA